MKKSMKEMFNNYKELIKLAFSDLKTKEKRYKQIPNILTSARLIAAPCFIIPAAIAHNVYLIGIFTIIFSLTDAVDGYIARKYNCVSELGKDLDAVCDKVFASSLLIAESIFIPTILFNLAFEVIIAIINLKVKLYGQTPRSLYVGKIKTCVLYPLIIVGFLTPYFKLNHLYNILMISTITMQMLTVAAYLMKYKKDEEELCKEITTLDEKNNNVFCLKENIEAITNKQERHERMNEVKEIMQFEYDYNKKVDKRK